MRPTLGATNADAQLQLIKDLRRIRIHRGLSAAEVGERMDASERVVAHIETGGVNLTFSTLRAYAKAVGAELNLRAVKDKHWTATPPEA